MYAHGGLVVRDTEGRSDPGSCWSVSNLFCLLDLDIRVRLDSGHPVLLLERAPWREASALLYYFSFVLLNALSCGQNSFVLGPFFVVEHVSDVLIVQLVVPELFSSFLDLLDGLDLEFAALRKTHVVELLGSHSALDDVLEGEILDSSKLDVLLAHLGIT